MALTKQKNQAPTRKAYRHVQFASNAGGFYNQVKKPVRFARG
jgi:hypothetical protein